MTNTNKYQNIPVEKLRFANKTDLSHDKKFETKPVSYFKGAFSRFCKNKGAVVGGIVILCLILFAIIAPYFTPFTPAYYDLVDHTRTAVLKGEGNVHERRKRRHHRRLPFLRHVKEQKSAAARADRL